LGEIGVIFDCDGVLADTEGAAARAEIAFLAELGMHYTEERLRATFLGLGGATWRAALDAEHLAAFGTPFADADYHRLIETVGAAVLRDLGPVPGGPELARRVQGPKAVASSSFRDELHAKLRRLELWEAFAPNIVSADDVPLAKPAPDLFLAAAAGLGLPAHRCRVIEDSVAGVRAAVAAQMPVVGYTGSAPDPEAHGRRLLEAGAQAVAADMTQAGAWFASEGVHLTAM
jgi:HAD superfamily hydrolase (TIGR01509 family)